MSTVTGRIAAVFGNMVTAELDHDVMQNAVAYCCRSDGQKLMSEVIRVRGNRADLQVFEDTRGLKIGDDVEFTSEMLSVVLGPGLLGQVYDGLQNPLHDVAEQEGYFLTPGVYIHALDVEAKWEFTPKVEVGRTITAGEMLGTVPEGIFKHEIMVPFTAKGEWRVEKIAPAGSYTVEDEIATLSADGQTMSVTMQQNWPVKVPLNISLDRLLPTEPLVTKVRIIDSLFPVVRGGTYCIPGPFGAGKTVLQQLISRHADVDVVVVAACGERAGEVVETIREFPELDDPRTGRKLIERTIIICNTSAMPVAAREATEAEVAAQKSRVAYWPEITRTGRGLSASMISALASVAGYRPAERAAFRGRIVAPRGARAPSRRVFAEPYAPRLGIEQAREERLRGLRPVGLRAEESMRQLLRRVQEEARPRPSAART
ncbi:hypothetical protein LCGC14_2135640 [marine sediment metagenome]|uniref:ATPase F1/V1/A1 complex alpha/beta subunit nucleotide-binding domain-containing protein n=1 Tax=marine sediment metagenome TaxID=412755 RepID=A0A0F9EMA5_9ZZZZ